MKIDIIFGVFKQLFKWFFPKYVKPYSISDDLQTADDLIKFDNAVIKSRKERIEVSVSLSNGKIITVRAFN